MTTATTLPLDAKSTDWEAEISQLLAELSAVQTELLEVLQLKRDRLAAADAAGLADLSPREDALIHRLEACQVRRRELLVAAAAEGLPGGSIGLLANTAHSSARGNLGEQVKQVNARTRLLQHHSLANWVLAQRSLLFVSQLLEIVATGGRLQPTYGDKESVFTRGALVNHEA